MFGSPMYVKFDGFGVTLRPPTVQEMKGIAPMFSSAVVHKYTHHTGAVTPDDEEEYYHKMRKDDFSYGWAIVPDDNKGEIVGFTSINGINPIANTGTTGIIIADTNWWGKGVATRAHYARTLWASYINLFALHSEIRAPNEASLKAVKRMGYMITGVKKAHWCRDGNFMDTYVLSWLNPVPKMLALTRPNGLDEQEEEAVARATKALKHAEECVKFL